MKTKFGALVKREFTLATPWQVYLFSLLGLMTLIPSYPSIVGFGYIALAIFTVDGIRRANRDLEYTIALPVERKAVVKSKASFIVIFELAFLFLGAIGAVLSRFLISPNGNIAGLDGNFTLFGVVLLGYGVFNFIYLGEFFKTGYKSGKAVLLGVIAFVVLYGAVECLVNFVPTLSTVLDGYGEGIVYRVIAFVVGAVAFVSLSVLANKRAQKKFERVNL